MREVVERLRRPSDSPRLVMTVNAAIMCMAESDEDLTTAVEDADLRLADGMGVLWAWRALGRRLPERVAGIDLMANLVAAAAADGRSIYLLGARPHVVADLAAELARRHQGLRIAGSRDGYFDESQHRAVIDEIAASGADVLFLGMPSPFKEVFAHEHLDEFGADLVIGVGGSFDVLAGYVRRAPAPLQRIGLEWAWRLACEPRRMWRRYLITNTWLARRMAVRAVRRTRRTDRPRPAGQPV